MNNILTNSNVKTLVRKGQVWHARLIGEGSMENGLRPVIIYANSAACRFASTITVVPLTSKNKKDLPTHTKISKSCGLEKESIALAENIITISKSMLISYIGEINTYELNQLENSILVQLGIQLPISYKEVMYK